MPSPRKRVLQAFRENFGSRPEVLARAPGRVNLLGAHIDTHEGWVLPAAIDRSVWLAARQIPGRSVRLRMVDLDLTHELDLDDLAPPVPERSSPGGPADLLAGCLRVLEIEGSVVPGMEIAYGGDLPIGAGVSSSAAVESAFFLAWRSLTGASQVDRRQLALWGRRVENDYLGVGSGVMDQMASLLAADGHVLLLDCRDLSIEQVPFPPAAEVLVVDCGVRRVLAESGFDDRRGQADEAYRRLREHLPELRTLRDLDLADLDRFGDHLSMVLRNRARHVVEECQRVLQGAELLRRGDVPGLGRLIHASHRSSQHLYETSIPELDALVDAAEDVDGCYGARLAGGGFGGCVLALVQEGGAEEVGCRLEAAFEGRFGRRPPWFKARVAAGAEVQRRPDVA